MRYTLWVEEIVLCLNILIRCSLRRGGCLREGCLNRLKKLILNWDAQWTFLNSSLIQVDCYGSPSHCRFHSYIKSIRSRLGLLPVPISKAIWNKQILANIGKLLINKYKNQLIDYFKISIFKNIFLWENINSLNIIYLIKL